MIEQITDLWPSDIVIKALSPVAILNFQAGQLRQRTKGLLEAKVVSKPAEGNQLMHDFVIVAAALGGYSYQLFTAWHGNDFVYPVTISFREWVDRAKAAHDIESMSYSFRDRPTATPSGLKVASTPEEFTTLLKELLGSAQTKLILMSLLSRINDAEPANIASQSNPPAEPSK